MRNHHNSSLDDIVSLIRSTDSIVVCSHYGPDPDAYGSSCALTAGLRLLGKKAVCVNEDGGLARLAMIPGVTEILREFPPQENALLIACDCGDQKRIGDVLGQRVGQFSTVINIDHHASNDLFGHLNYVLPTASSTSEIILALLEALGVELTAEIATALFYGISGDTGSFRYSSTTAATFEAARKLVAAGASPAAISQSLYNKVSLGAVRLHSEALSQMTMLADGKVAETVVTEEMVRRHGAEVEDGEDLKYITQTIAGVELSVIIREVGDIWRVSLRSKDQRKSVALVAERFGGGGHHAAAAFRWRGTLDALRTELRPVLCALAERDPHQS